MGERLTALDGTFLELEQVDESAHMHIGAIMVFDPTPGGGAPDYEELCRDLESRLVVLPRYSQRLSDIHTGGLSWPEWQVDPAFDVRRHVGRAALPAPGGPAELAAWSSMFFSQRLDRHRPLWEMVLVEGLTDGRWALATKTHHCMVDGVGSVDVGHVLLDADAAPAGGPRANGRGRHSRSHPAPPPIGHPAEMPHGPSSARTHTWPARVGHATIDLAEAAAHGAVHPREALRKARGALGIVVDEELHPAPHTSLNEAIGTRRRFEVVEVAMDDLRTVKKGLGGTINDVVLAITGNGLRELLVAREEALPEQGLRVMVPMNVRLAGEQLALGNKISSLFLDLPVREPILERRYRQTAMRSSDLKSDGKQAAGTSAVIELTGLAPPFLHGALAQALYATRLFNLTVTNVPGPQATMYAHGAALREVHPLVPLAAAHGVGVAAVSYDGRLFFGVVADPDAVPDLDVMVAGMRSAVAELLALATRRNAPPKKAKKAAARPATRPAAGRRDRRAPR